jgi:pSer/pThr/pTyr-binding forkhead associated (FHA) protein
MPKAFLKIVAGVKQGMNVPLPNDRPLLVGRRDADLVLDDPMVSGRHLQISLEGETWFLQDLGSTNGTMVDGRLVREVALTAGSEITIGSARMVLFVASEEELGDSAESQESPRPGRGQLEVAWLLDEELVEVKSPGDKTGSGGDIIGQDLRLPPGVNAVVEVVAGQDSGRVYRFVRGNVAIGRRMGEIPLTDAEVSRRHAVVEVFGREMIFLRDLGSTNGTYHNGMKVGIARLKTGDTIGVGKTVMRLKVTH